MPSKLRRLVTYVALVAVVCFALGPFVWMFIMSLQSPIDAASIPPKLLFSPTLNNYAEVLGFRSSSTATQTIDFVGDLTNSVIITSLTVGIGLILGVPAGYALARWKFRGRDAFGVLVLALYFAPSLIIVLPLYQIIQAMGVQGTFAGMLPAYEVIAIPLIIWLSRSAFESVPIEIEESARVDGASRLGVLWRVALPLAVPGIASAALLATMFVWNNFFFAFIFSSRDTRPVTVGALTYIGYANVLWGQMAAAVLLSALPVVLLGVAMQRYLVRGLTYGAVK